MFLFLLFSVLSFFVGLQVYIGDQKSFSRDINYRVGLAQLITLLFTAVALSILVVDFCSNGISPFYYACLAFVASAIIEWVLSKMNLMSAIVNSLLRIFIVVIVAIVLYKYGTGTLVPFIVYGLYIRNCPFGVVNGKDMFINIHVSRERFTNIEGQKEVNVNLPSFSLAGSGNIQTPSKVYDVSEHGIIPNSKEDVLPKVQELINKVGEDGGGVIFFPKGKYLFNKGKGHAFLKIDHSNISIKGETDSNNNPLAELICCNDTLQADKNPWLSPFFITTGEQLERSNIFFGLQFKKKKNIITRSGSLADPGSDGTILMPKFATKIIKDAVIGTDILDIEDSDAVGKYIMIGMYNTSKDGNLIKDILGVETLRPEWKTALRAGDEVAPSFQWFVEVKDVLSKTRIRLARPLLRSVEIKYDASVYNVDMLENISIENIKLSSKWNGLFRHHGFPIYYNVGQAQRMDYGWNAINIKRVAHGKIDNVIIENFTNPLYVMDSRNVVCENITIQGYDGHQGIKIYGHACDNLFENITFYNHFADMLGGEGNAYGNVFSNIRYLNPCFKPVDFDFHGFSEGPFSPPAYNLFECIYGFRHIKTAAATYNLPGCAQYNAWWNICAEGERKGEPLFICLPYVRKSKLHRFLSSISRMIITSIQSKSLNPSKMLETYKARLVEMDKGSLDKVEHQTLYHNVTCVGFKTFCKIYPQNDIRNISQQEFVRPTSLYNSQHKC